jgi:hypothetical protein
MWKGAVECLFEVLSLNLPVGTEKNQRNSSLGRWSINRDLNFGIHQYATGDAKPKTSERSGGSIYRTCPVFHGQDGDSEFVHTLSRIYQKYTASHGR